MFELTYACSTDVGRRRKQNQDMFVCDDYHMESEAVSDIKTGCSCAIESPFLLAVFDGMGGEQFGEKASLIAGDTAVSYDFSGDPNEKLDAFIRKSNRAVCDFADSNGISSTGSTAAMLLFDKDRITMCNLGDSPVFEFEGGNLTQISVDHVGFASPGHKAPLFQCLGIHEDELELQPCICDVKVRNGVKFLICSDGLTDMVSKERIAEIMKDHTPEECVKLLVQEALENGGKDNVTVIVAEIKVKKKSGGKIFAVMLLLIVLGAVCAFALCYFGSTKEKKKGPEMITFATKDSSFSIVYPANSSEEIKNIANSVRDAIKSATGTEPETSDDTVQKDGSKGEILIGITNRSESSGCPGELGEKDYFIGMINGSIVILGGSEVALKTAAENFTGKYISGREKCEIPVNLSYLFYPDGNTYKIPEVMDRIKVIGRYSFVGKGIACDLSGSGIEFTADCEGDVSIQVEAPDADVFYVVYIDGVRQEERIWLKEGGPKTVVIASGLERGVHYFRFLKDSESRQPATIYRISFAGAFCEKPEEKEIYLEFVGDSITCGYDLGEETHKTDSNTAHFGATKAFPFICAEKLNADYSIVAISGYAITGKGSIPDLLYPYTSWKRKPKPKYDFARVPTAVIVNLGTNESGGSDRAVSREEFEKGVRNFIKTVREDYRSERLPIIFVYDMMRDGYQDTIKKVVKEYGGESAGLYTYKGVRSNARMNNHPGFDAQRETGEGLADFIKTKVIKKK